MIAWFKVRRRRDVMLSKCDWTQASDSPLSDEKKAEWRAYRQALRDLPSDYSDVSDILDIVWPTKPV